MEHILNELSLYLSKKVNADIVTAYIPQFGYLIAIERCEQNKNKNQDIYLALEIVFQTSTTNYYKNDTMLEMDSKYGDLYTLIRDKEIEILYKLKSEIMPLLNKLLTSYPHIGHIDMMICFANVCLKNKFSKPVIIEDEDGKHID